MAKHLSQNIEKLNGPNWNKWNKSMFLLLNAAEAWGIVSGTEAKPDANPEKWMKKDFEAQALIFTALDDSQAAMVYSCETSKETYDTLKAANADSSLSNKTHTLSKYYAAKCAKGRSAVEFMTEMEEIARCLSQMGSPIDDASLVCKIVTSLPDDYEMFKISWDNVETVNQTRAKLRARLFKIEQDNKNKAESSTSVKSEPSRAFHSKGRNSNQHNNHKGHHNNRNKDSDENLMKRSHLTRETPNVSIVARRAITSVNATPGRNKMIGTTGMGMGTPPVRIHQGIGAPSWVKSLLTQFRTRSGLATLVPLNISVGTRHGLGTWRSTKMGKMSLWGII